MNNKNIGVFDSGMGGLTVLRALRRVLPQESFIYLGDTARLPYGTKSRETVKAYAVQMARQLVERNIKALVIACNTATTEALDFLTEALPDVLVAGVVKPGAKAAVTHAKAHHRIAVLATETTVNSGAYQHHINELADNFSIKSRACPLLVALAEEGMNDNAIARLTLEHYLQGLTDCDSILLGCTHFPVFKPLLQQLLPNTVIVDSAFETAKVVCDELKSRGLLRQHKPMTQFLVTDSVARFKKVGSLFLGHSLADFPVTLI